jgi:predicted transcriptional regulator
LIDVLGVSSIPNIKVGDVGIKEVWTINPDSTLKETAKLFAEKYISGAPVVDNGKLVGIISLHDIAENIDHIDKKVKEVMRKNVLTIHKDEKIYDALKIMNKNNVGRLVIVDDNNKIVGIITRTDILKIISGKFPENFKANY